VIVAVIITVIIIIIVNARIIMTLSRKSLQGHCTIYRVTTCLENLEYLGMMKLIASWKCPETDQSQENVREKSYQVKPFIANFIFRATPVFSRLL